MKRADNWPTLLTRFIEERRAMPFAWGSNDCCLFAADWCRTVGGIDFAEGIRGTYSSALGAMRVLEKHGGVFGLAQKRAGLERVPKQMAQRGDIVAHEVPHGVALGICLGAVAAFVGRDGLTFAPIEAAVGVWRI